MTVFISHNYDVDDDDDDDDDEFHRILRRIDW